MLNISTQDAVRTLVFDRPEAKNTLVPELAEGLISAFDDAAGDPAVKVLVLAGSGGVFSAGIDLSCLMNREKPENKRMIHERLPAMVEAFIRFPKPLILAINGIGVGFGATLCGLGDVTIMEEDARLRAPFTALGVVPELASTYMFPALMGRQKATWMLMAAEWIDAQAAYQAGLVMEVVGTGEALAAAQTRAATLAALPLDSLVRTKRLLMAPHLDAMLTANREEFSNFWETTDGPAAAEAVNAFLEKRAPDFSNH
ncbi:MAG: enoyl-CoA hydratase-related protein [Pseudomonadota bacterium]